MQTFAFSATVVVSPLKFFATTIVNIPQFAMRYACNDIRIVVLYLCQNRTINLDADAVVRKSTAFDSVKSIFSLVEQNIHFTVKDKRSR